jgi:hypothetical protein
MPIRFIICLLALGLLLTSCARVSRLVLKNQEFYVSTVGNNVCKRLHGEVVLYAIFVDSRPTNPWSTYDITSTLDSIRLAIRWLETEAAKEKVFLKINLQYHKDDQGVVPIEGTLAKRTLAATVLPLNGIRSVDHWADGIARKALSAMPPDTATITRTKIKPGDRERLIARLRDIYKTDHVTLMYFINNYYRSEISVVLHSGSRLVPEYAVVSFKDPAVIAHEFLHLFGAVDLYITPFDRKQGVIRKKAVAMKMFPKEIMAFPYRGLHSLEISPFTQYLIGWDNELDPQYSQSLISKRIKNMFWIFKYLNISNLIEIAHFLSPLASNGWD